jgi:predicted DCC family thiol-disulfide oxidoreductase YuxK
MYDSGACSEANCEFVRQQGLHYLMCLKADQPTLLDEARLQLRLKTTAQALASSDEILSGEQVTRWLWLGFIPAGFHWKRSLTVVRVHKTTAHQKSGLVTAENHYYVSSLRRSDLNPGQWLLLIRRRRAVEGHNTLDKIMREDTRPWLLNPHGLLVLMMLRRAVYNILALYRCRTQRSDDRRHMPRRELIRELRLVLRTATAEHLAGLHLREVEEAAGVCPGVQSPVRVGEGGRRRTWSSAADPAGRKQAARVDLRLRAGQGQGARPPAAGEDHGRSSGDRFWGFGAPLASRGHGVYARLAPGQVDPEARSPEADLRLAGGLG